MEAEDDKDQELNLLELSDSFKSWVIYKSEHKEKSASKHQFESYRSQSQENALATVRMLGLDDCISPVSAFYKTPKQKSSAANSPVRTKTYKSALRLDPYSDTYNQDPSQKHTYVDSCVIF